jgi:quinol monooxygenase YgiN
MPRVMFQVVHHPHPEHVDDLLDAMRRIYDAAPGVPGLEAIGAFRDDEGGRVFAVSLWSSPEAMEAGMQQLFAWVGELPFDVWERQPYEALVLPEVAVAPAAAG